MLQVALFYSVVISATKRLTRADLAQIAQMAETEFVATALSTGNLILRDTGPDLDLRLQMATETLLGKAIPVFVRSAAEFLALLAANPFPDGNPSQTAVRILRSPPSQTSLDRIASKLRSGERFLAQPRALWLATKGDLSKSPLLTAVSAPWVGPGTMRSASALTKIAVALPMLSESGNAQIPEHRMNET